MLKTRQTGLLERYHATRNYLGYDACVISAARYSMGHDGKRFDKATLYPAVCRVLDREPALSFNIEGERSKEPFFSRLKSIDLNKAVVLHTDNSTVGEENIGELILENLKVPLDATAGTPLWRIVVIPDNTVIFAYSHTIGDGGSGPAFHRNLVAALNEGKEESATHSDVWTLKEESAVPWVKPMEQLTDLNVSWMTILKTFYRILVPTGRSVWTGKDIPKERTLSVEIDVMALNADQVGRLLAVCRTHKASMTAALQILAVATMSSVITSRDPNAKKIKAISALTPVSLRPFTKTPITAICDHVSTYHSDEKLLLNGFSWEVASEYTTRLHASLPRSREAVGVIKYLYGKYESFFHGQLGSKRPGGIELSNLGPWKVLPGETSQNATSDGWKIQKLYFAQNDALFGAAMKINVAGDPEGGVGICFTWSETALDDGMARAFLANFKQNLEQLIQDN